MPKMQLIKATNIQNWIVQHKVKLCFAIPKQTEIIKVYADKQKNYYMTILYPEGVYYFKVIKNVTYDYYLQQYLQQISILKHDNSYYLSFLKEIRNCAKNIRNGECSMFNAHKIKILRFMLKDKRAI